MKKLTKLAALLLVVALLVALSSAALAETTAAALPAAPDLIGTAIEIIAAVVQAALLGLVAVIFAKAQQNTKSERLKTALEMLEKATYTTVNELQETTVERLKAASKDGKLTKQEIKGLADGSLALIKQRMGAEARGVIEAAGLDLEDRIKAEVKARITEMKGLPVLAQGIEVTEK